MHERERDAMRTLLTTEAARRFGVGRAAELGADIDALAGELAQVATAAVPDETEPAFFLLEEGNR